MKVRLAVCTRCSPAPSPSRCAFWAAALALALIWLWCWPRRRWPRRRANACLRLGVSGTLALGPSSSSTCSSGVYNFRETDAANLQDYIRQASAPAIWAFSRMALGLLAWHVAAESFWAVKLAGAVPAGVLLGFCVTIVWRGMPNRFGTTPLVHRCARMNSGRDGNGLLDWDDTVSLHQPGRHRHPRNYYGFELNATPRPGAWRLRLRPRGRLVHTTHMNLRLA